MNKSSEEKSGLAALGWAVGVFVCVVILWLVFTEMLKAPNRIENSAYFYSNSVWRCEEADVQLLMDHHQECYGIVNGGEEILYLTFREYSGRGTYRDFSVYVTGVSSVGEAAGMRKGYFERIHTGRLETCDESGLSFPLRRRHLPLWGVTEPTMLHFTREELPETICFDPDCPQYSLGGAAP